MKSMIKNIIIYAIAVSAGFAEPLAIQGMAEVDLKDASGKAIPEKEAVRLATEIAQFQAVENAISRASSTIRQQYAERVGDSEERKRTVMNMVVDKTIQTEPRTNLSTPRMRVYLRGKIDMTALRDQLNSWPKMVQQVDYSEVQLALFYTVRKIAETVRLESGRESSDSSAVSAKESGSESITENGVEVSESVTENVSKTELRKSINRADELIWEHDVDQQDNFGSSLTEQFTEKGFESIMGGEFFEVQEVLNEEVGSKGRATAKTLKKVIQDVKDEGEFTEGGLVVIGNLDFKEPVKDSVSGLWSVEATMKGKIYKIGKGAIPRTVGALEVITKKSLGETQESAKTSVLSAMAPLAADEIISKLKNKGEI
ncbi:MAG: hypothetical protein L7T84_07830 [Akkermansiaceae bacterium]|nr:hypothetical protein [Akkermansiaceae bacterium]